MRITGLALGLALFVLGAVTADPCPKCGDICTCTGDIFKAAKLISPGLPGRGRPGSGPLLPIYGPVSPYGQAPGYGYGCRNGPGSSSSSSSPAGSPYGIPTIPYAIAPTPESNVYGVISGYANRLGNGIGGGIGGGNGNGNRGGCSRSSPVNQSPISSPVSALSPASIAPSIVYIAPAAVSSGSSPFAPSAAASSSAGAGSPFGPAASSSSSSAGLGPISSGPYGPSSGSGGCGPAGQGAGQPGINYLPSIILSALSAGAGYGQGPINQQVVPSQQPSQFQAQPQYIPSLPIPSSYNPYAPSQRQSQSQSQYGPNQQQSQYQSQSNSPYAGPISVQPIIISSLPAPASAPAQLPAIQPVLSPAVIPSVQASQPGPSQVPIGTPICLTLGGGPNSPSANSVSTSTSTSSVSGPSPFSPQQTSTSTSSSTSSVNGPTQSGVAPVGPIYILPSPGPYQQPGSNQEPCNDGSGPYGSSAGSSSAAGPFGASSSAGASAGGPFGSSSGVPSLAGPFGPSGPANSGYDDDDEGGALRPLPSLPRQQPGPYQQQQQPSRPQASTPIDPVSLYLAHQKFIGAQAQSQDYVAEDRLAYGPRRPPLPAAGLGPDPRYEERLNNGYAAKPTLELPGGSSESRAAAAGRSDARGYEASRAGYEASRAGYSGGYEAARGGSSAQAAGYAEARGDQAYSSQRQDSQSFREEAEAAARQDGYFTHGELGYRPIAPANPGLRNELDAGEAAGGRLRGGSSRFASSAGRESASSAASSSRISSESRSSSSQSSSSSSSFEKSSSYAGNERQTANNARDNNCTCDLDGAASNTRPAKSKRQRIRLGKSSA